MNDMGKVLLVGGLSYGAYLLYQRNQDSVAGASATPTTSPAASVPSSPSSPAASPQPVIGAPASPPPTSPALPTLRAALLDDAAASGLSPSNVQADQWSYFYQHETGKPAIDPTTFGLMMQSIGSSGQSVVSVDQFIQALASQGLGALPIRFLAMRRRPVVLPIRRVNYVRAGTPMVRGAR